jgi:hypothetical protein
MWDKIQDLYDPVIYLLAVEKPFNKHIRIQHNRMVLSA